MGQVLHGSAATTEAVRPLPDRQSRSECREGAIRNSQESLERSPGTMGSIRRQLSNGVEGEHGPGGPRKPRKCGRGHLT